MNNNNYNIKTLFWGLSYQIALFVNYLLVIHHHWSYSIPIRINYVNLLIVFILSSIMLVSLPKDDSIVSFFLLVVLFIVLFPMGVVFVCHDQSLVFYCSVVTTVVIIEWLLSYISFHDYVLTLNDQDSSLLIRVCLFFVLLLSAFILFKERGIPKTDALDFSHIYDIRSSYSISSIASYLTDFSTKTIIPFLIGTSLYSGKYKRILLLLVVQVLFFFWTANKSILFSLGTFFLGYIVARKENGFLFFAVVATVGVSILTVMDCLFSLTNNHFATIVLMLNSYIMRRAIFEPALLKFHYFDFFVINSNPKAGLLGTIVAPILTRIGISIPYSDIPYTKVIGIKYFDGSNANTGIFGEEIAHFGFLGIPIAAFSLMIFLLCIRSCEKKNGKIFTCCVAIYIVVGLVDAGAMQLFNFSPVLLMAILLFFYKARSGREGYLGEDY